MVKMTMVNAIEEVTSWALEEICKDLTFKLPDEIDPVTGMSKLQLVTPYAFSMFVPGKEQLPPGILAPAPSIVVQVMEGEDKRIEGTREMEIRLSFCTWNPGLHLQEIMTPHYSELGTHRTYTRLSEVDFNEYKQTLEGWKDVYLFVDTALKKLEGTDLIGGMRIKHEDGIKFGPFKTDGMLWDQYPYWSAYISFTLQLANIQPAKLDQFL